MSFLTGKPAISQTPQQLNSINVDRSRYGDPVPLLYGTDRVPAMLGWYGGFNAVAQTQNSAGKGGGGKTITGYNYTASCVMLLVEGFSGGASIGTVWKDKAITSLVAEGLALFSGTPGQATWSYLTTNFASQAINYNLTAYIAGQNINLGSSAALPNYTYEVHGIGALAGITVVFTSSVSAGATSATLNGPSTGLVANGLWDITFSTNETRTATITGSAVTWDVAFPLTNNNSTVASINYGDADPSAIWLDYCENLTHGANFFLTDHGIQGAGNTYQTYCKANWMQISVYEDTARSASSCLSEILEITNSNCFMSAGVLKIVPYCDATISGNGVTYTPNLTPLFNFTDDDYLPASAGAGSGSASNDPVQCIRKPATQMFNCVRVEYLDRSDNYNAHIAEWKDPQDIKLNGLRVMAVKTFHQIKMASLAQQVATLIGQRQLYIRRTFQFAVRSDLYTLLEPMDLITLTDTLVVGGLETRLGLISQLCRVIQTDDDEHDVFTITCEEMMVGTASAPRYNITGAQGFFANYAATPPDVATPIIFLTPPALATPPGGFEIWCAVGEGSAGGSYGGANVYASLDDLTWSFMGTITGQARLGTVTTSHAIGASTPNASDTFFLTMNAATDAAGYQLDTASASDFAANRSLIWVDGEVVSFQTVTLLSTAQYSVTVKRGMFGTTAAAHSVGAAWCRLDPAIFQFPIDPGMVGQTLHMKFYSFNLFGQQTQTLATDYAQVIAEQPGQFIGQQLTLVNFNGMTIIGNSVTKTKQGAGAWDGSVYSAQSYINGAFVSWQATDTVQAIMVGLNTDPTMDGSYASIDYAMYQTGSGPLQVYNNGANVFTGPTYAVGDILMVSYDGAFVRYSQNGTVFYQQPVAPNLQLYLDSSFFNLGATVKNIQFGPYGTATPVLWIPRAGAVVSDENVTKASGGSGVYDCDAYSINGYKTCHLSFKGRTGGTEIVGFIANPAQMPPATIARANITHGIELIFPASCQVVESGSIVAGPFSYVNGDFFSLTYDGTNVVYSQNDTTLKTTAISSATMFGDVAIAATFATVNSVEFGPGPNVAVNDSGQLGANAATSSGSTTVTGQTVGSNVTTHLNNNASITVGPFPIATTVVIDVTASFTTVTASFGNPMAINYGISTSPTSFSGNIIKQLSNPSTPTAAVGQGLLADEAIFALAANTTATYYFNSGTTPDMTGVVGSSINLDFVTLKFEAIKR